MCDAYKALEVMFLEDDATLPTRAYQESAGYDLYAYLLNDARRPMTAAIAPRSTRIVRTGIALRPPRGHCVLVCSRSGLAACGVLVANSPGVIDPDYTGEIKVILYNGGIEPYYVRHGDRIAQALVVRFAACDLIRVNQFPPSERGDRGLGSTGP